MPPLPDVGVLPARPPLEVGFGVAEAPVSLGAGTLIEADAIEAPELCDSRELGGEDVEA